MTAKNPTPVSIAFSVFSNRANATLRVPYGCKAAYEAADYWNEFKEIIEIPCEITIGSDGIATYCSPYGLDFTDSEVKAYIVSAFVPSTGKVILTRINIVPENTGIVVKGAAGTYGIPYSDKNTQIANLLVGVTEPTTLNKVSGDYTNYIFARKNEVLGFYPVADGSTLGANKAYLPILTSLLDDLPSAARLNVIFDDDEEEGDATGVAEVRGKMEDGRGEYYNLNGQRMKGLQKGLNIVDGKKIFVK